MLSSQSQFLKISAEQGGGDIRFTSSSLGDRKNLQVGDSVCYQHGVHKSGAKRAVNVQAKRKMQESLIDSIKGDYGFIVFEGKFELILSNN